MRKISPVISLIILASIIALPNAGAASVKSGATCTKAGATSTVANVKFTCIKSGKKLVWGKGVVLVKPSTPTPAATPKTKTKTTLITLVNSAKRALTNPESVIPIYNSGNKVTISNVGQQNLSNFVSAATKEKFTYIGPKPLVEDASNRSGAVSLITQGGQKAYRA
jgi:hypothetical protein